MTIVKARLRLEGSRGQVEDIILVDTGASLTIVDKKVANTVGVIHLKRTLTLTTVSSTKWRVNLWLLTNSSLKERNHPMPIYLF